MAGYCIPGVGPATRNDYTATRLTRNDICSCKSGKCSSLVVGAQSMLARSYKMEYGGTVAPLVLRQQCPRNEWLVGAFVAMRPEA